ncbi:MAG: single-stranded-DNA-specific exonuclease RecJ [Pseudomonadota bacterium]
MNISFTSNNWYLRECDKKIVEELSRSLSITKTTARVLANRGISDPENAFKYLNPNLSDIPDPFTLPDMKIAVGRIALALNKDERIGIFGDYDVDGVTATALLASFLSSLGHKPYVLLPDRLERGYGLNCDAIDKFKGQGVGLIITVDNGIRATEAVARAREFGMDVIVTDHHMPEDKLPKAFALVDPKLMKDENGLEDLSGCGVAFMLALALRRHLRDAGALKGQEPNLKEELDIVALGTIADIMPLTGTNRIFTAFGLLEIARAQRLGIRALMSVSGTALGSISPGMVAFRLAPRINAAGRIGTAYRALDLLLTDDEGKAFAIALELDKANRKRQSLEEKALSQAHSMLKSAPGIMDGIVVHGDDWHVGIIGIVAAKLAEIYERPAVVITRSTNPPRGSARTGGNIDLLKALAPCSDILLQYGGHTQAAGLSIEASNIPVFEKSFSQACKELGDGTTLRHLKIDSYVKPSEIAPELMDELERCAPFGIGNPEPVLAFESVQIVDMKTVGNGHVKLRVLSGGISFDAIGFNMADKFQGASSNMSIAFTPQYNTWNGRTTIQLKVRDILMRDRRET